MLGPNELWNNEGMVNSCLNWLHDLFQGGANHALVFSGLDTSDPAHAQVILTDSATGQQAVPYPLEQFLDAWKDGNCHYVVADVPPPQELGLPEMANFNYQIGHIESIYGQPYAEWAQEHISCFDGADAQDCDVDISSGVQDGDIYDSVNDGVGGDGSDATEQGILTMKGI